MARAVDLEKRDALREAIADDLIAHGLTEMSLAPMAARLGTSARTLLHYFKSREALVNEALQVVRSREDVRIRTWMSGLERRPTITEFFRWSWSRSDEPQMRALLTLMLEIHVLALHRPQDFPGAIASPLSYWRAVVLPEVEDNEALATMLLTYFRGMAIDVAGTGEHDRIKRGQELFLGLIDRLDGR